MNINYLLLCKFKKKLFLYKNCKKRIIKNNKIRSFYLN